MAKLLYSRKFWLMVVDTTISLVLFYFGKSRPDILPDVEQIIAILQPVFITLIYSIATEDAARMKAGYVE
jgi:hypothetical protein